MVENLVHPRYCVLMKQSLFGSTSSHAQDGYFGPESPTCLAMNVIFYVGFLA